MAAKIPASMAIFVKRLRSSEMTVKVAEAARSGRQNTRAGFADASAVSANSPKPGSGADDQVL